MSLLIKLDYPLNDSGEVIKSVDLRRPKVRDMISSSKAEGSDAEQEVRLFASLCNLTPDLIEDMDVLDYRKLQAAYTGFLGLPQEMPGEDA